MRLLFLKTACPLPVFLRSLCGNRVFCEPLGTPDFSLACLFFFRETLPLAGFSSVFSVLSARTGFLNAWERRTLRFIAG